MAADDGQPARTLTERLFEEPHAFEFAQAVRLLELLRPHAQAPGTGLDPRQEALALSGTLSPAFPASALGPLRRALPRSLALEPDLGPGASPDTRGESGARPAGQPQLQVNSFALGGPDGPLPGAWQEWLQDRLRRKDSAATAFLDIFQNRLLALLYHAQRKYRSAEPLPAARTRSADVVLRAITGLVWASPPAVDKAGFGDSPDLRALLARAGLFANRRRSLAGFDVIALHHFRVPVRSTPFAGGWQTLPAASRTAIGTGGRNRRIGVDAVAGTRIWDEHRGIRVCLGPLNREQYEAFLPGAPAYAALNALAAAWFGPELQVHLELQIPAGELQRACLSRRAPLRLGWTAWSGAAQTAPARLTRLAPRDAAQPDPAFAAAPAP